MNASELHTLVKPLFDKIGWPLQNHEFLTFDIGGYWLWPLSGQRVNDFTAVAVALQHASTYLDQHSLWATDHADGIFKILQFQDDGLATIATGSSKLAAIVKAAERFAIHGG